MNKEYIGLTPKYVAEASRYLGRVEADTHSKLERSQDFKQRVSLREEVIGIRRRHGSIVQAYLEGVR